ncbi:MAG TPA: dockerin type I repeat-containing protein [Tepidisphaeraceae bacterium]|nr:dockerin type I repeat-containing protein [Tepidisphaeraceae bacterium]
MCERKRGPWFILAAVVAALPSMVQAQTTVFYDDFPSAASLNNPALTLSGTTDELVWATGIADGIAGPTDGGGVIYSYDRNPDTDSNPYAFMTYSISAPAGELFSNPSATITCHTYDDSFAIVLAASTDGVNWQDPVNGYTDDYSGTDVATNSEAGNASFQNLSTLYFQIAMPTFNLGTSGGEYQLGILDNITIKATVTQVSSAPQWGTSSSGDWNVATNWTTGTVPNAIGAEADMFSAITSNRTVYTDAQIIVGTLNFNNPNTYEITGTGSLVLEASTGNAQVIVQQGTQEINLPTTLFSSTTFNVASGANLIIGNPLTLTSGVTLSQTGGGEVTYNSIINVDSGAIISFENSSHAHQLTIGSGGTAVISGSGTVLQLDSLSNGGTIDLQSNTLSIVYGNGVDPIATVKAAIVNGYDNGAWNGTDPSGAVITSSYASAHLGTGIGYSDVGGVLTLQLTWQGDLNLDGAVTASDITSMNFMTSGATWSDGDFNYDGAVNADDVSLALLGLAESGGKNISTLVPEPAAAVFVLPVLVGFVSRRSRKRPL